MLSKRPRLLFISHDASRTGAPLVLLEIIKWLKINVDWDLNILLGGNGPLSGEFAKHGRIFTRENMYISERKKTRKRTAIHKLFARLGLKLPNQNITERDRKLNIPPVDLIYSNTVANGELLDAVKTLDAPIISHIHEMNFLTESFGEENWDLVRHHTKQFIAVSHAVKRDLQCRGIHMDDICVIHPAFCARPTTPLIATTNSLYETLNIPKDSDILVGCGTNYWQKGVDHFINITSLLKYRYGRNNIRSLWIGGDQSGNDYCRLLFEIKSQNLQDTFTFIPHVHNPLDYINLAKVFCMTSREDSFPLVNLEAGYLRKPVVCFRQSGGTIEFLNHNSNLAAEYADCDEFARKVNSLLDNPSECEQIGSWAHNKVATNYTNDLQGRSIKEKILSLLQT
jgi:glycosyltransferase involved in cell wall biosynthesis